MPQGFFGSRADLLVDIVLVFNLVAPVWAYGAARLARRGDFVTHRRLQIALCVMLFVCLFSLEGSIRMHGGSGSLIAGSPYAGTALLKGVFIAHIGPAVITYIVWAWLTFTSYRRKDARLPGDFSATHRRLAYGVIAGLLWTAVSAVAVYYFGFLATGSTPTP